MERTRIKLNIVGSILGTSGYDNHTKGLANALYKINPDIKLDVPLAQGWEQVVNDAELVMIKTEPRTPDVTIAIMTPPNWRIALADNCKHFVGYCVWEGDKIPKYWIEYLEDERVEQIWVPSQHTKDAIMNTISKDYKLLHKRPEEHNKELFMLKKIKIVPHGYDPEIFKQINTLHTQDKSTFNKPFCFICNKGWRGGMEDRGGVQYVLKAFANEFKKDENVELTLKLNPAYINPQIVTQKINELELPKDAAKIRIACANMSQQEICKLYNESDVCVCATRAEAFDLGTAEAMACGLPIITTNYGGQIEHMDETCAGFVSYELADVKGDLLYEGVKQAIPNVQKLQELMRASFSQRDITAVKGEQAEEFISRFTWENSAVIANSFLKELK